MGKFSTSTDPIVHLFYPPPPPKKKKKKKFCTIIVCISPGNEIGPEHFEVEVALLTVHVLYHVALSRNRQYLRNFWRVLVMQLSFS